MTKLTKVVWLCLLFPILVSCKNGQQSPWFEAPFYECEDEQLFGDLPKKLIESDWNQSEISTEDEIAIGAATIFAAGSWYTPSNEKLAALFDQIADKNSDTQTTTNPFGSIALQSDGQPAFYESKNGTDSILLWSTSQSKGCIHMSIDLSDIAQQGFESFHDNKLESAQILHMIDSIWGQRRGQRNASLANGYPFTTSFIVAETVPTELASSLYGLRHVAVSYIPLTQ